MPYTVWAKPKVRAQDFDPHRNPNRAAADSFRRQIAERDRFAQGAEGDGAIQHWKYSRPRGQNRHLVRHPKDQDKTIELPATAQNAAFVSGQYVAVATDRSGSVIIGSPAPGQKGTSGFVADGGQVIDSAVGITRVEPSTIPYNGTIDITVTGFGFKATSSFRAVQYSEVLLADVLDPLLTINTEVFVDSTTFTLNVTSTAPIGYAFDLEVT